MGQNGIAQTSPSSDVSTTSGNLQPGDSNADITLTTVRTEDVTENSFKVVWHYQHPNVPVGKCHITHQATVGSKREKFEATVEHPKKDSVSAESSRYQVSVNE